MESVSKSKAPNWWQVGLLLAGLVVVAGIVAPHAGDNMAAVQPSVPKPVTPKPTNKDHPIPTEMPNLIGEQFVSPSLKDPSSGRYRNITYRTRSGIPVLCGEVNARNSFGGYTGFQNFVAMGKLVQIGGREMPDLWNTFCVKTDADDAKKHRRVTRTHLHAKG